MKHNMHEADSAKQRRMYPQVDPVPLCGISAIIAAPTTKATCSAVVVVVVGTPRLK